VTNGRFLLENPEAATHRCGDEAGMLAVASEPSAEPEVLRRVAGVQSATRATPLGDENLPNDSVSDPAHAHGLAVATGWRIEGQTRRAS
jgi:hypothetical protein